MRSIRLKESSYLELPLLNDNEAIDDSGLVIGQFYRFKEDRTRIGQWMRDQKTLKGDTKPKYEMWLFKLEIVKDRVATK